MLPKLLIVCRVIAKWIPLAALLFVILAFVVLIFLENIFLLLFSSLAIVGEAGICLPKKETLQMQERQREEQHVGSILL